MGEAAGRRRAASPVPHVVGRPKGGKRAARRSDTQSIPAFIEHEPVEHEPFEHEPVLDALRTEPPAGGPKSEPQPESVVEPLGSLDPVAPTVLATTAARVPQPASQIESGRRTQSAARRRPGTGRQTPRRPPRRSGRPGRPEPVDGSQQRTRNAAGQPDQVGQPHQVGQPGQSGPTAAAPPHARVGELAGLGVVLLAGLVALVAGNGFSIGPAWLGSAGGVAITVAYVWALAARTGGRPIVFGGLAAVVGIVTLVADRPELNTGAAATAAAVAAVLGMVVTVPAVHVRDAIRETCIAVVVAAGGAVAALGFRPHVDLGRFEYTVLVLSLACAFTLVYRLGAGLHGLGRRGVFIVLFGAAILVATLLYTDALRHYADSRIVQSGRDLVHWSRDHIGAFPRPVMTVLGVPALLWGTHMRARRRQGWWVCAFGVAGTSAVSIALMNPDIGVIEVALSILYGLVVGLVIGYVVIRIDLALTGSGGGRRAVSRRGRRAEEREKAVRPEPKRTGALL